MLPVSGSRRVASPRMESSGSPAAAVEAVPVRKHWRQWLYSWKLKRKLSQFPRCYRELISHTQPILQCTTHTRFGLKFWGCSTRGRKTSNAAIKAPLSFNREMIALHVLQLLLTNFQLCPSMSLSDHIPPRQFRACIFGYGTHFSTDRVQSFLTLLFWWLCPYGHLNIIFTLKFQLVQ